MEGDAKGSGKEQEIYEVMKEKEMRKMRGKKEGTKKETGVGKLETENLNKGKKRKMKNTKERKGRE